MSTPTNPIQLMDLPAEILLGILKVFPDIDTLFSFIQANSSLYTIWETNQYAICQAIAKNMLGPLWPDAYNLLIFQGGLKRQADITPDIQSLFTGDYTAARETGWGVLEGGIHIGIAELRKLLQCMEKVRNWRFCVLSNHTQKTDEVSAENEFVIDRAFFRYWLILLATAPQLISYDDHFAWAGRQGRQMEFLTSEFDISDNELERKCMKEFSAVEPFLRYQGREQELIELCGVADHSLGFASLPGCVEEGGGHYYYGEWVSEGHLQAYTLRHITRAAVLLNNAKQ